MKLCEFRFQFDYGSTFAFLLFLFSETDIQVTNQFTFNMVAIWCPAFIGYPMSSLVIADTSMHI